MARCQNGIMDVGTIGSRNLLDHTSSSSSNSKMPAFHSANALDKEGQAMGTGTRWNPAPEQIQALEEMYRRGLRTPTAHQIQHIASQLARFGKIQGKNVFYWFQNHKARERQKRRRVLNSAPEESKHMPIMQQHNCFETTMPSAETSLKRTCAGHNSNWGSSACHPLPLSRESIGFGYMQRAAVGRNGSKQFVNGEPTVGRRSISWQVVQLSPGHVQFLHPMNFTAPNNLVKIDGIPGKEDGTEKIKTLQLFPTKNDDCWSKVRENQPFTDAGYKKSIPDKFFKFL